MFTSKSLPVDSLDCKGVNKDSSSDTHMENASILDSSLTECKHDVENWDDPGNLSYRVNDKCYSAGAEKQVHSSDGEENLSATKNDNICLTRYFIIKSLNDHNIQLSIEKGIWATQVMNEPILEEAFHNSGKVILIFSVNMSGFFQGYAQMMSSVGWRRDNVWSQASSGSSPWGCSFKVKWLRLHNLPFQKTLHLKNPLNDYKPVKISRDCQELSQGIGEALCRLLDVDVKLERGNFSRDDLLEKRRFVEPTGALLDEDYFHNGLLSHMAWAKTPTLHPSLLYQNLTQNEGNNIFLAHGRYPSENLPTTFRASKERSHLTCSLSEDDFLEMSYEEYLEVCHRIKKPSYHLADESPSIMPESLSTKHDNDSYSRYLTNWYCPQTTYLQYYK